MFLDRIARLRRIADTAESGGSKVICFARKSLPLSLYPQDYEFSTTEVNYPVGIPNGSRTLAGDHYYNFIGMIFVKKESTSRISSLLGVFDRVGMKVVLASSESLEATTELGLSLSIITAGDTVVTAPVGNETERCPPFWIPSDSSLIAMAGRQAKVEVVQALQRAGYIVGFIGGSMEDVTAMQIADVSLAVGTNPEVIDSCDGFIKGQHLYTLAKMLFGYIWQITGQPDYPHMDIYHRHFMMTAAANQRAAAANGAAGGMGTGAGTRGGTEVRSAAAVTPVANSGRGAGGEPRPNPYANAIRMSIESMNVNMTAAVTVNPAFPPV
jgi:hypothetical protein